jgi:hypothetical protein
MSKSVPLRYVDLVGGARLALLPIYSAWSVTGGSRRRRSAIVSGLGSGALASTKRMNSARRSSGVVAIGVRLGLRGVPGDEDTPHS